jgi:hypothetical protein
MGGRPMFEVHEERLLVLVNFIETPVLDTLTLLTVGARKDI